MTRSLAFRRKGADCSCDERASFRGKALAALEALFKKS